MYERISLIKVLFFCKTDKPKSGISIIKVKGTVRTGVVENSETK